MVLSSPNHEAEVAALLAALRAVEAGALDTRLPVHGPVSPELADAFNRLAARAQATLTEVGGLLDASARGQLDARARLPEASGAWRQVIEQGNRLAERVGEEVHELLEVSRAVARGELSRRMTVAAEGEMHQLNAIVNAMVERLRRLADDVARVSREVGSARPAEPPRAAGADDVTGLWKELSDNLTLAEQLALVSRYKSEWIASMSHELRTPLNSVLVLARLLSEDREATLTERQREYAETIHASGGDLLALVNDILDLSRAEAGRLELDPVDLATGELTRALERHFRPVAEEKGLGFTIETAADAPQRLYTDGTRLEQVLRNLLANAIKFTARGGVSLRVRAAPGDAVVFVIEDTGIGIAEDGQERIFEAFQQADRTIFARYGGTGLGLSISRELTTLLGGRIELDSRPGEGSVFTVTVPRRVAGPTRPRRTRPSPGPYGARPPGPAGARGLAGATALVVDEDARELFTVVSLLEAQGMVVRFADSPRRARELAAQGDVAVVVVSTSMRPAIEAARLSVPGLVQVERPLDGAALVAAVHAQLRA